MLESGVEFRPMALISGAGFWSVCQGPKDGRLFRNGDLLVESSATTTKSTHLNNMKVACSIYSTTYV